MRISSHGLVVAAALTALLVDAGCSGRQTRGGPPTAAARGSSSEGDPRSYQGPGRGTSAPSGQASAHYHKGLALKRRGEIDAAIRELRQALAVRDDYAAAHFSLGVLYKRKRDYTKAVLHLERAAELDPESGLIRYSLGLAHYRAGRQEQALEALREAARLEPKDHQIRSQLGVLLMRDNPREARTHLEAALAIKPNDPDTIHQLGLAHRRAGDLERAKQYLLKAASAKSDAKLEFDLGVLYRRMNKPLQAIDHYERAIHLDPKLSAAHWDVAHMYTRTKQYDKAVKAYRSYLQLEGRGKAADIARKRIEELEEAR